MFHWMNFRSEPKKATVTEQAFEIINIFFRRFFATGSWFLYFLALLFLIVGVVYFFIDEARKRSLLERRREIRRSHERPPQKRRPGAIARNHEIYRTVMGKVKEYIEPNINQTCVFRQTRSGTIYGQVVDPNETNKDCPRRDTREEKSSEVNIGSSEVPGLILH
ncbi:unnamed protein product [Hermetia illucens]|uniref:Uncharacterized protein n=2 Tax=Hermetia illucens TaxID=343691 RepID=A0A7R8YRN9_HERIL|nr:unnamed protein product [Hermetia illucens]